MNKITVIIAAYNALNKLSVAINSVLGQNDPSVQLLVVDGGSTDGTVQFLESIAHHQLFWISEPDTGIYEAWNKGLSFAAGQWIVFLGADDYFLPDSFRQIRNYISSHDLCDFISFKALLVPTDGGVPRVIGHPWRWSEFRRHMNINHVGAFHHANLFKDYGQFNPLLKICGDYEFLLRPRHLLRSGFIDNVLVEVGDGGVSKATSRGIFEVLSIKLNAHSVRKLTAYYDFLEALCKWYLRKYLSIISRYISSVSARLFSDN